MVEKRKFFVRTKSLLHELLERSFDDIGCKATFRQMPESGVTVALLHGQYHILSNINVVVEHPGDLRITFDTERYSIGHADCLTLYEKLSQFSSELDKPMTCEELVEAKMPAWAAEMLWTWNAMYERFGVSRLDAVNWLAAAMGVRFSYCAGFTDTAHFKLACEAIAEELHIPC